MEATLVSQVSKRTDGNQDVCCILCSLKGAPLLSLIRRILLKDQPEFQRESFDPINSLFFCRVSSYVSLIKLRIHMGQEAASM